MCGQIILQMVITISILLVLTNSSDGIAKSVYAKVHTVHCNTSAETEMRSKQSNRVRNFGGLSSSMKVT